MLLFTSLPFLLSFLLILQIGFYEYKEPLQTVGINGKELFVSITMVTTIIGWRAISIQQVPGNLQEE